MRAWSGGVICAPPAAAEAGRRELLLQRVQPRRQILGAIAVELDAQQRARIGLQDAAPQRVERGALFRVVEDEAVHHLDRRRAMTQEHSGVAASASSRSSNSIVSTALAAGSGTRLIFAATTRPSVPSEPTISFARLNGLAGVDELVEVVAADAPQDFRESGDRSRPCTRRRAAHRPIARRFERDAGTCRVSSSGWSSGRKCATEPSASTTFQLEDVIDRLAVEDRPRAARVVRDHAADGGAAGGGDVGREAEAVRPSAARSARRAPRPARSRPSARRR